MCEALYSMVRITTKCLQFAPRYRRLNRELLALAPGQKVATEYSDELLRPIRKRVKLTPPHSYYGKLFLALLLEDSDSQGPGWPGMYN